MVLEFILRTRVKYLAICIVGLFCLILYLSGNGDHSVDEERLGLIQYKKNLLTQQAELRKKANSNKGPQQESPADFQVHFVSGKELAKEVDNEHKSLQVHTIKITNVERTKVVVDCEDPFSSFGKAIIPGGVYEFTVTDLFSKRHYWCSAKYGTTHFLFKAYGEGAPRDNNQITLKKEGAFINGKLVNIEDHPMPKLPPRGVRISGLPDPGEEGPLLVHHPLQVAPNVADIPVHHEEGPVQHHQRLADTNAHLFNHSNES